MCTLENIISARPIIENLHLNIFHAALSQIDIATACVTKKNVSLSYVELTHTWLDNLVFRLPQLNILFLRGSVMV